MVLYWTLPGLTASRGSKGTNHECNSAPYSGFGGCPGAGRDRIRSRHHCCRRKTLFGGVQAGSAARNIVPFVLWFNFAAGFAYVIAGIGLLLRKRWAAHLSAAIAVTTIAVFIALGIHILTGLAFEARTVGAMTIRSTVSVSYT